MKWRSVLVLVAALAGGCVQDDALTYRELDTLASRSQREAVSRPAPDTCQMSAHQALLGASGDQIDRASLPANARVLCHDCMATLDYNSMRLNIILDADGKVESLRCG